MVEDAADRLLLAREPDHGRRSWGAGMAAGAPTRRRDHVHEAMFYDSDAELLRIVVPFLEQGLAAAEPTVVAVDDRAAELLRAAVDLPDLVFLGRRDRRRD